MTSSLKVKGDTFVSRDMKRESKVTQDDTCRYPDNWARSGVWNSNKTEQILLLFMEIALALVHTVEGDCSKITLYYKDKMFSPDILR